MEIERKFLVPAAPGDLGAPADADLGPVGVDGEVALLDRARGMRAEVAGGGGDQELSLIHI